MSHQASQSQVGDRKAYQKDEKTQYSAAEVQGVYEATGVNVAAYRMQHSRDPIADKPLTLFPEDPSKPINEMLKEEVSIHVDACTHDGC